MGECCGKCRGCNSDKGGKPSRVRLLKNLHMLMSVDLWAWMGAMETRCQNLEDNKKEGK